jgi:hypothetical protein
MQKEKNVKYKEEDQYIDIDGIYDSLDEDLKALVEFGIYTKEELVLKYIKYN